MDWKRFVKPVSLITLGVFLGSALVVWAEPPPGGIEACVGKSSGHVRIATPKNRCLRSEYRLAWNKQGPPGASGAAGAPGSTGASGSPGSTGPPGSTGAPGATGVSGSSAQGFREMPIKFFDGGYTYCGPGPFNNPPPSPTTYQNVRGCTNDPVRSEQLDVTLDSGRHPASTQAEIDLFMAVQSNKKYCFRLFDLTTNTPVQGSEICLTNTSTAPSGSAGSTLEDKIRSAPFTLPLGEHTYVPQHKLTKADGSGTEGSVLGTGTVGPVWLYLTSD